MIDDPTEEPQPTPSPPLSEEALARWVEAWIGFWKAPEDSSERESMGWAMDWEFDLKHGAPDEVWKMILAVLRRDASDTILPVLAAGPLEDLLVYHGPAMIERMERQAQTNPAFAHLLGGVWQRDMDAEVWARAQAVVSSKW